MRLNEGIKGFLDHYEHEKQLSQHSLRAYRTDLRHFSAIVGDDNDLSKLTASWIEESAQC